MEKGKESEEIETDEKMKKCVKSTLKGTRFELEAVKEKAARVLKELTEDDFQHCFQLWKIDMERVGIEKECILKGSAGVISVDGVPEEETILFAPPPTPCDMDLERSASAPSLLITVCNQTNLSMATFQLLSDVQKRLYQLYQEQDDITVISNIL